MSIEASNPAFEGHFPGSPAYPGVGQLWLTQIAADAEYDPAFATGLRKVRFRAPIPPDSQLAIELRPAGHENELRVEIRDLTSGHESVLTEATLLVARERDDAPDRSTPAPEQTPLDQPDRTVILPHRGPALLFESVLALGTGDGVSWVRGRVPQDNFLIADGRVTAIAAVEFASQAGPVVRECQAGTERPLEGFLAGVRRASFARPDFDARDDLVAAITTTTRAQFMTVQARVFTARGAALRDLAELEVQLLVKDA